MPNIGFSAGKTSLGLLSCWVLIAGCSSSEAAPDSGSEVTPPPEGNVDLPDGRTGNVDLIDPQTLELTSVGGFTASNTWNGSDTEGVGAADAGGGWVFGADRSI